MRDLHAAHPGESQAFSGGAGSCQWVNEETYGKKAHLYWANRNYKQLNDFKDIFPLMTRHLM